MLVKLLGSVILVKLLQLLNELDPILVKLFGSIILIKSEQL